MRILLIFSIAIALCATSPSRKSSNEIYKSTPAWTNGRETRIETKLGPIRLRNFTKADYQVDTALLGEIFDRHARTTVFDKKLELHILPDNYVIPTRTNWKYVVTDTPCKDAWFGITIFPNDAWKVFCVQPVGWARDNMEYAGNCIGAWPVHESAEMLITMSTVHELIGHGAKRSALVAETAEEECEALALERLVLAELEGRVAFRKSR